MTVWSDSLVVVSLCNNFSRLSSVTTLYMQLQHKHTRALHENWVLDQSVFSRARRLSTLWSVATSWRRGFGDKLASSSNWSEMTVWGWPGYGFYLAVISAGGFHHLWKWFGLEGGEGGPLKKSVALCCKISSFTFPPGMPTGVGFGAQSLSASTPCNMSLWFLQPSVFF